MKASSPSPPRGSDLSSYSAIKRRVTELRSIKSKFHYNVNGNKEVGSLSSHTILSALKSSCSLRLSRLLLLSKEINMS